MTTPTVTEKLEEKVTSQAGLGTTDAALPTGTDVQGTALTEKSNEIINQQNLATAPTTTTTTAPTTNLDVATPPTPNVETYTAYTTPNTTQAAAAQGALNSQAIIGNIQGAVSNASLANAAQGTVSKEATVQYQLSELFKSIGTGTNLPGWASPAVTKVSAIMAQRGLGASSMASAAMTQAVMESAIPIAAADAKTYAAVELQNLSNRQQATMQNALTVAAMDRANLNSRLQASVNNARNFLSIDLANLTNQQKTNEINFQGTLQKLFTDQAAQNAARQFNAKTQNEVNMFFDELGTQVENANKNRVAAQNQFNADQSNAQSRFVSQLQDSREKFNQNMQLQINQNNAQWRRNINTANTSLQNETNRINAQNLLQLNQNQLNNVWQRYRDEASWLMQSSENAKARAHQVAMFAQESSFDQSMYDTKTKDIALAELGRGVIKGIFNLF
tara:strand:- start:5311 stop:6651 length:1341 start_codon:yes stop_codon:yes gene_type:complete